MSKSLIILILLAGLTNCSSPKSSTGIYHLDPKTWPTKTIDLERVIEEIRIVPLETRPDCLIDYIISMQFTFEMILTLEGNSLQIYCFDLQGKFLRKFGARGQGPGEYSSATGLLISQDQSEIFLNSFPSRKVSFFNLSGKFLRLSDQEFGGYKIKVIDKDLVAIHAGRMGLNRINCEIAISDLNGKVQKTYFPFSEPTGGECCAGFAAGTKPGSILYHKRFDFHVYEISADRLDTLYTLDFGPAALDTGANLNTGIVDKLMEEDGKIVGFNSLANTPDHLIANIYTTSGFGGSWILDHKSKNNMYLAFDTLVSFGKFRGIPINVTQQTQGSWFISPMEGLTWYETVNQLTEAQKIILRNEVPGFIESEKVTMDGNPVLVYYRFKNF